MYVEHMLTECLNFTYVKHMFETWYISNIYLNYVCENKCLTYEKHMALRLTVRLFKFPSKQTYKTCDLFDDLAYFMRDLFSHLSIKKIVKNLKK